MSDLESHEEITEQIENFGKEVELKLGSTFSNTKDLSIDLSYRRLVFDNEDDYNKIEFSKTAEMELGQGEESFKVSFGGKRDDEIHIFAERHCLLIYDENTHTWTLECVDYNYNVGTGGDYGSDFEIDDYERQFETSMQDEDQDEFADEFDAKAEDIEDEFIKAEDIEDEFIEGYNGNVENPLQPSALGANNEGIIKNETESSGTSSSGSSSSSASGSESDNEGSDSTGSELGSDNDLRDLEAHLEAQLTEAPNDDTVKANGVNRKTNPSTGRPGGPISLTELFGGTGNEHEQDDESGSSSASD
ncbi:14675_t:CDS:2 [Cetraspora pellucida]|uniref:14675_t:CDS:1 n=1 Tax=Cetraspora pellucida TaxID=1433469 RepID=A0ACA9L0U3_9GLOM|nr:14675_t:CDS:2 [Cetraspora pellucida]